MRGSPFFEPSSQIRQLPSIPIVWLPLIDLFRCSLGDGGLHLASHFSRATSPLVFTHCLSLTRRFILVMFFSSLLEIDPVSRLFLLPSVSFLLSSKKLNFSSLSRFNRRHALHPGGPYPGRGLFGSDEVLQNLFLESVTALSFFL